MNELDIERLHLRARKGEYEAMLQLAEYYAGQVDAPEPEEQMHAAMELAYLLRDWPYSQGLWDVIARTSAQATVAAKEALTIAIFEPLPEEPRDERILKLLWHYYGIPALRWVVEAAYRRQAKAQYHQDREVFKTTENLQVLWTR